MAFFNVDEYLPQPPASLQQKRALITGASSGIGLATACQLAAVGIKELILTARRAERLDDIKKEFAERFPNTTVHTLVADVRTEQFYEDLTRNNFDDIHILINNAGLAADLDLVAEAKLENWQRMIDTNITAAFRVIHQVLPKMIARNDGHIVNIASIAGLEAYERGSVYCATKHALRAFSKALRQETCGYNIRVSVISPGMAETEFSIVRFHGDNTRAKQVYAGMEPLHAREIAEQIVHVLTQPSHVNIDEIVVMPRAQGAATKVHRQSEK